MSAPSALAPRKLSAGTDPSRPLDDTRLLAVSAAGSVDARVTDLVHLLGAGDLLVLNDSATLPASLAGHLASGAAPVELRLASRAPGERASPGASFPARWRAVLFGAGDWRDDTDVRPAPPPVAPGAQLVFGRGRESLAATVEAVSSLSPRLVDIRFDVDGAALAEALYRLGRPVQYRHLQGPIALEHVQTPFAARPWSMEMPSTGRPLSWATLERLQASGVAHVFLTHAAGLSATGDPRLDAALPLPEPYEVSQGTLDRVDEVRARGGRVIAVGTTVVRALEEAARTGARTGVATLRVDARYRLRLVDDILTGVHSPGESHFELLGAFAPAADLWAAHHRAAEGGYLAHELGDLMLIRGRR